MKILAIIALTLVVFSNAVHKGEQYIECIPGGLNVILAAPHGGYEDPEDIADRDAGCYIDGQCVWSHDCGEKDFDNCETTTVRDSYTQELTRLIQQYLFDFTGQAPTVVINLLSRVKLDANRDINEATFGNAIAVEAWEEFHRCINESKQAISADTAVEGKGLFLDIHGHGHPNVWAELGYLLNGDELDSGDFEAADTSIVHLSTRVTTEFENLLRGDASFGHFLEENGYAAVPSPNIPSPDGEAFFSGGYNTRIHGSNEGGTIDAIQIESAFENRDDPERDEYARAIALTTVQYMQLNYPPRASRKPVH